ncbi:MAG TPA: alpha/beta fold hydrolase [Acidimicrobiales bacterium]|nr:alpha/beta fold hydrolase [Acidimicrobiales bacterium]
MVGSEGGAAAPAPRRVQGAGLNLAATEYGDASRPTVLLVHGFPDTSAVWGPLVRSLSPDFHVVTYDVRGAGQSDTPASRDGYALELLAADVAAVADTFSPSRPVHLVAHDWGSIQAWEAVTTVRLTGRFASYTSISGPPIDHAALWARAHRTRRWEDIRLALRQAIHSWYIAFFHLPVLPNLVARIAGNRGVWSRTLHRVENVPSDGDWPAPTLAADFSHGVELYRANIRERFRRPRPGHTDTPVQIVVAKRDRYVMPALLQGLEAWSPTVWKREVDAGHWVIRTHPTEIARWVREVIEFTEDGREVPELAASRVAG